MSIKIQPNCVGKHGNLRQFFQDNDKCLSLDKVPQIKLLFESLLNTSIVQKNDSYLLFKNESYPYFSLSFKNSNAKFYLECLSYKSLVSDKEWSACEVHEKSNDVFSSFQKIYVLRETDKEKWEECLVLSNKLKCAKFSKLDNPKFLDTFIKKLENPSTDLSFEKDAPISSKINPLNVTLVAVGTAGLFYCIYKIHSLIAKHWKHHQAHQ